MRPAQSSCAQLESGKGPDQVRAPARTIATMEIYEVSHDSSYQVQETVVETTANLLFAKVLICEARRCDL